MLVESMMTHVISHRGHWGEKDPWQTQGGLVTEPVLRALNIPTWYLNAPNEIYRGVNSCPKLRTILDRGVRRPGSVQPASVPSAF